MRSKQNKPNKVPKLRIKQPAADPNVEYFNEEMGYSAGNISHQPVGSGGGLGMLGDNQQIRSVEELNMLQELDRIAPEDLEQRKVDMNDRLARKGVSRAIERVEIFKQRNNDNLNSPDSYIAKMQQTMQGDHENIPTYVERQRQVAAVRVKMQRKLEDEAILQKLEEDSQKEKEYKEKMEQKAEQLRKKTEERVADLKV